MILVHEPCFDYLMQLQNTDSGYYWSRLAPELLRAHGLVSVQTQHKSAPRSPATRTSHVFLRSTPAAFYGSSTPCIYEAPLHEVTSKMLGASPRDNISAEEVTVFTLEGAKVGTLQRRGILCRDQGNTVSVYQPNDPLWQCSNIPIEDWTRDPGEVLAWMELCDGRRLPAAVRRDSALIFAVPVFDITGGWLAFPSLSKRYAGVKGAPPFAVFAFCIDLIEEHLGLFGNTILFAEAFPPPFTWALSVRHDYDRAITDSSWRELLEFYDKKGIAASVGFLDYLKPQHVVQMIESAGHEVQLHCFAQSEPDLRTHLACLSSLTALRPQGVTIHGGPSGGGFLGDTHMSLFQKVGLWITENYGVRSFVQSPVARIINQIPSAATGLSAPPFHFSLDGSTRPGDHKLAKLKKEVAAVASASHYAVIMNHPDIHRDALCELLDSLDLSRCWRPTISEAMQFYRASRANVSVVEDERGQVIELAQTLAQDCVSTRRLAGKEQCRTYLEAGRKVAHVDSSQ